MARKNGAKGLKMEKWKKIEGFENYQISNMGRVKILKGEKERISEGSPSEGYRQVQLLEDGIKKMCRVHRLVALTFIPNSENKPIVNHINGIKHDNRAENLEWFNQSENIKHAYRTGLVPCCKGVNHSQSKLTEKDVLFIREKANTLKTKELSLIFSVSCQIIRNVITRRTYKNIP